MFVNTNSSSLRAQSMLFESSQAASTAMERLATGSKINSVQDDVAGSAIADRMTSQVRGLNMAVKNVNDAMAMLSVADNAAGDITDMLQRMRELAIQAASDTNSAADRQYLQGEVNSLIQEIDRVATQTQYNGMNLLDGSKSASFQVGASSGQTLNVDLVSFKAKHLGSNGTATDIEKSGEALTGTDSYGRYTQLSDDGLTLMIGTPNAGDNGPNSGRVDVYSWVDSNWAIKGGPFIGQASEYLGTKAKISSDGDTLLIAQPGADDNGSNSGRIDLYAWNGTSWQAKGDPLLGVNNEFGSVHLGSQTQLSSNGNVLVVGQNNASDNGYNSGRIDTYQWNGSDWVAKGSPFLGEEIYDELGRHFQISKDGNTLVVSNPRADNLGFRSGRIDIFSWDGSSWQSRGSPILGASGNASDEFGQSFVLSESGDTLVIGNTGNRANGLNSGSVDVYKWDGSDWAAKGSPFLGNINDSLGRKFKISADGNTLAIGNSRFEDVNSINPVSGQPDNNTGRVDVYSWTASGWQAKGQALLGQTSQELYGDYLDLSRDGNTLVVGNTNTYSHGAVEVYSWDGGTWQSLGDPITPLSQYNSASENFGLSADGQTLLISHPGSSFGVTGKVQSYSLNTESVANLNMLSQAPQALKTIIQAIETVTAQRAEYGAMQNRLQYTISNLMNVSEQTTAARSRIEDADFATESAVLARAQVLQQTGAAMLAQANARPQLV
ncbi:flagellin, partial [Pseudomonadales bacterium]|nr:flagellin [Pseudomonadales bacterium]